MKFLVRLSLGVFCCFSLVSAGEFFKEKIAIPFFAVVGNKAIQTGAEGVKQYFKEETPNLLDIMTRRVLGSWLIAGSLKNPNNFRSSPWFFAGKLSLGLALLLYKRSSKRSNVLQQPENEAAAKEVDFWSGGF